MNVIRKMWDSFLGRVAILAISAGWLPYTLLTMVLASLQK